MYYVLYRLICNLVPFATDMIYGRHLGFQNYPILVFWQSNPVNLHPNLASTQHTFAKDVLSPLAICEDMGKPILWRQWRHDDARHKGRHEQRCDTNSKRSGRDWSTSTQRIWGGQAENNFQHLTNHWVALCQRLNWRCSVHLKQSRGQEARNKSHLWRQIVLSLLSFPHCLPS